LINAEAGFEKHEKSINNEYRNVADFIFKLIPDIRKTSLRAFAG
jgi:hypothetical protein